MKIRCLIIDRNPIFSEKLAKLINAYRDDFQVQTFANVDAAIEVIASTEISLVLCEPALADPVTGLVACIMDRDPAVPLIVTGQEESPALDRLVSLECVKGFITRPNVQPADLAGKVVLALGSLVYQGNIRGVNCITLIQILEQENKDCSLRIMNNSEKIEGWLFLKKGNLLNAVCGASAELEAVKKIFCWESVDIELYNICPLNEKRIDADITTLILQCTEKQRPAEPPPQPAASEKAPKATSKPVGGLAGLYLKKAKKK
jgi:response regulator RpfG family c-di-GMP phosphodiesterase